jgi:hypothetical protein
MTGRTHPLPHTFVWLLAAITARCWALALAVSTGLMLGAAATTVVLTHVNPVVTLWPLPPANHMNA